MHQLKYADALALRGDFRIVGVNFWPEIRRNEAPPCMHLEHRLGVCPMGLSHAIEDREGCNTIVTNLKKSVIDQMVGNVSPTSLLITRIGVGTDASATLAASNILGVEAYRDVPTFLDDTSNTQLQVFWYFGPDKANAGSLLQEWGIFGGGATSTANSGAMLARFLQPFDKNIGTAVNGQYTFNVA